MRADFSLQKWKVTEKRKKATRKLKMPPNQHASRQPADAGRASLVKRTLGWRFVTELLWRSCFHFFFASYLFLWWALVKRQRENSKNRRVRLKTPETQTSKGRSGVHLLGSLSLPPRYSLLLSVENTIRAWCLDIVGTVFLLGVLCGCGDKVKKNKK